MDRRATNESGESQSAANGDLPEGWTKAALSDVTLRIPNVNPKGEPNREFGYIDISSIDNTSNAVVEQKRFKGSEAPSRARRPIQPGDVLFSNVRTYLRNIALVPAECNADLCSTGFTVIRSNGAVDPKYLFFYALTDRFIDPLTEQQTGSNYPATNDRVVLASEIPLPPLAEQGRIVAAVEAMLARVGAARARLDRAAALLRRFRQAVLSHATTGHLTAAWRDGQAAEETGAQLLERILSERQRLWEKQKQQTFKRHLKAPPANWKSRYPAPEPARADELPELPEGWVLASVDSISTKVVDGVHKKPEYVPSC